MHPPRTLLPVLATIAGIAVFSAMDAVMKGAALAAGVYTAVFLRNTMGAAMMVPVWLAAGRPMAGRAALRVHVQRALVTSGMAMLFFYSLTLLPLAEAIALSFIAPLIALYLAALLLGEQRHPSAIVASLMGIAGVVVIVAARFGEAGFQRIHSLALPRCSPRRCSMRSTWFSSASRRCSPAPSR